MEIKALTVADLKTALSSENFWHTEILPITKHRALSHIHNPRADTDDLVLWVAYQDKRVIGYLGILPDEIFVKNAVTRFGWLTGWWVDPACRNTGVGAILLFKAMRAYQQQLGISGGSKEAAKVLRASGKFFDLNSLQGLKIRFRFNAAGAIPRRFPTMKFGRLMLKTVDIMMDEIANIRSFFWKRRIDLLQRLDFEYISRIDEETGQFIERHHRQDLTRKGRADLNWIMAYPWILTAPVKDSASRKYYFSSLAGRFVYLGVKVLEQNNGVVGFLLLKVRDDRMSVMYSYFENHRTSLIAAAVIYHALAMEVSTLCLYDERLVAGFSESGCPCWSAGAVSRGFLLSKAFADMPLSDCRIHGGDGDLAFY